MAVEDHVAGDAVGKEVILDLVPEGERGRGTDDMIAHGVGESGIDPQNDMGIQLEILGGGVGRRRVLDEVGDAIAEKHHEEEGLPFVVVVICWVEE